MPHLVAALAGAVAPGPALPGWPFRVLVGECSLLERYKYTQFSNVRKHLRKIFSQV